MDYIIILLGCWALVLVLYSLLEFQLLVSELSNFVKGWLSC
nr:MAG TPA: hypothetical protein [Crassvirales sp.]